MGKRYETRGGQQAVVTELRDNGWFFGYRSNSGDGLSLTSWGKNGSYWGPDATEDDEDEWDLIKEVP